MVVVARGLAVAVGLGVIVVLVGGVGVVDRYARVVMLLLLLLRNVIDRGVILPAPGRLVVLPVLGLIQMLGLNHRDR